MGTCASTKSTPVKTTTGGSTSQKSHNAAASQLSAAANAPSDVATTVREVYSGKTSNEELSQPKSSDVIAHESEVTAQKVTEQLQRIQSPGTLSSPAPATTPSSGEVAAAVAVHQEVESEKQVARVVEQVAEEADVKKEVEDEKNVSKLAQKVTKESERRKEEDQVQKVAEEIKKEDQKAVNDAVDKSLGQDREGRKMEDVNSLTGKPHSASDTIDENKKVVAEVIDEATPTEKKNIAAEILVENVKKKEELENVQTVAEVHAVDGVVTEVEKSKNAINKSEVKELDKSLAESQKQKEESKLVTAVADEQTLAEIEVKEDKKVEAEITYNLVAGEILENSGIKSDDKSELKNAEKLDHEQKLAKTNLYNSKVVQPNTAEEQANRKEIDNIEKNEIDQIKESIYVSLMKDDAEMALQSMVSSTTALPTSEDFELYEQYPEVEDILNDYYKASKYLKTKKEPLYFEDLHKFLSEKVLKPYMHATKKDHRNLLSYHMAKVGFAKALTAYYKFLLEYCSIPNYTGGEESISEKLICLLRELAWRLSASSVKLAYKFGLSGFLELIIDDLITLKKSVDEEKSRYAIQSSLGILLNCAKSDSNRHFYRELHIAEHVMAFIHSSKTEIKAAATLILASILDEKHSSALEVGPLCELIIKKLSKALRSEGYRTEGYSAVTWAKALLGLASIDRYKSIFVEHGALDILCDSFELGDTREKRVAALAVWCLAFEENSKELIKKHQKLISKLEDIKKCEDKQTALAAAGALWVTGYVQGSKLEKGAAEKTHVMLSCNVNDNKLANKIRNHLQKSGLQVWMGDEAVGDLEIIKTAIESSMSVLACITDRFKDSPRNRTELLYAQAVGAPVIPLLIQRSYAPDGWLATYVPQKIEFDFSGLYSFDDNIEGLIMEIEKLKSQLADLEKAEKMAVTSDIVVEINSPEHKPVMSGEQTDPNTAVVDEGKRENSHQESANLLKVPVDRNVEIKKSGVERELIKDSTPLPVPMERSKLTNENENNEDNTAGIKDLKDWTDKEVMVWLQNNKLDKAKKLYFLSGEQLSFLYRLYKTAPEFFYTYVQNNLGVNDLDLLMKFSAALGKLKTELA